MYSFVQREYWDVGLFRYYRMEKVPNFVLAAPILALSIWGVARAVGELRRGGREKGARNQHPRQQQQQRQQQQRRQHAAGKGERIGEQSTFEQAPPQQGSLLYRTLHWIVQRRTLPYILHWSVLLVACVTVLHIEVSTRFLSACPALYWHAADVVLGGGPGAARKTRREGAEGRGDEGEEDGEEERGNRRPWAVAVVGYFILYALVGTVLHCSFYPWT